jgi:hypothetical protein
MQSVESAKQRSAFGSSDKSPLRSKSPLGRTSKSPYRVARVGASVNVSKSPLRGGNSAKKQELHNSKTSSQYLSSFGNAFKKTVNNTKSKIDTRKDTSKSPMRTKSPLNRSKSPLDRSVTKSATAAGRKSPLNVSRTLNASSQLSSKDKSPLRSKSPLRPSKSPMRVTASKSPNRLASKSPLKTTLRSSTPTTALNGSKNKTPKKQHESRRYDVRSSNSSTIKPPERRIGQFGSSSQQPRTSSEGNRILGSVNLFNNGDLLDTSN